MKTAELEGAALDYYVAKAEGLQTGCIENESDAIAVLVGGFRRIIKCKSAVTLLQEGSYWPSRDWACGGPLIEREGMRLSRTSGRPEWHALTQGKQEENCANLHMGYGPTPLIAAMRAFVASKFGDEVPDIKETA